MDPSMNKSHILWSSSLMSVQRLGQLYLHLSLHQDQLYKECHVQLNLSLGSNHQRQQESPERPKTGLPKSHKSSLSHALSPSIPSSATASPTTYLLKNENLWSEPHQNHLSTLFSPSTASFYLIINSINVIIKLIRSQRRPRKIKDQRPMWEAKPSVLTHRAKATVLR